MDEFIEQFIIESREHVELASSALVALDEHAGDPNAFDALFRSVHTLKGSAGIIEFSAMERLLHALESDLGQLKSNDESVSNELNARALACLDLIARWLDMMAQSGELPLGAEADVSALFDRLSAEQAPLEKPAAAKTPAPDWLAPLLARHAELRSQAKTAVRYVPEADCFFRDEDPLALIETLPGVLALELEPINELRPLADLDPYESLLTYTLLSSATLQEVTRHLRDHINESEIVAVQAAPKANPHASLSPSARELLEAQLAVLTKLRPETFAGVVASAGSSAANALTHCGLEAAARNIRQGTERSLVAKTTDALREQIEKALSGTTKPQPVASASHRPDITARTLRVEAERIEMLVRLVGELTVVRNAIGHLTNLAQGESAMLGAPLKEQHGVLDRITSDLQRTVLGIRVLPLRTVFGRFPPVIREIAATLGKPTKLLIEGDDTEADKAIIELLFEPLLHVVRNAMDHGIETPEIRAQLNKPAVATIAMRATRQGDRILIQLTDDGGGIDPERVGKAALKRGLIPAEGLAEMSESEVIDLIFAPGFSTASAVTELSGRGVGMDAVRSAVGRIGGTVAVESRLGEGVTITFSLPFSAMMSHVMTVEAGGQTFGIPLDAVVETIRVPVSSLSGVGAAHAIAHRNRTLPIFELTDLLQTPAPAQLADEAVIVVTSYAGHWGGIRVDKLGERLEVMLKPLDGFLAGIRGITGTTIMGDGRVLLVLDMGEILV